MAKVRVRALERGFDGVSLREPGEEFEFDGKPAAWFEPVDKKATAKGKKTVEKEPESGDDKDLV
jgi:hypothetical protein